MAEAKEVNRMAKIDPVENGMINLGHQLDELVSYKREMLKTLQQGVIAEQAILVNTKQEIDRAQREAKYSQQIEREKFLQGLQAEKELLQTERRALEVLDLELAARRKDVEILEAKASPIAEALKRLQDERIAIEQQRLRNEELQGENDRLSNATSALHEEVSQVRAGLLKQQTSLATQAVEQEQVQQRLELQQKEITLQVENLASIRQTIDPKLAEVQKLQAQAEADRHQAEALREATMKRQSEIDKQRADLAILSSQLQAKADALTEYDATLRRTEAELRIKLQQARLEQKVEVALPDKEGSPSQPVELTQESANPVA